MKTWEIDVEMRVRRTLVIEGPATEDAASALARMMLVISEKAGISVFWKWSDGRKAHRPMPVEAILGADPEIVAVREVERRVSDG